MKLKHNAGSKTDREKAAKQLVWAIQQGQDVPSQTLEGINLPPGTLDKAAQILGVDIKQGSSDQQILKKLQPFLNMTESEKPEDEDITDKRQQQPQLQE